jgi:hypothetical protein
MTISIDGTNGITFPDSSIQNTVGYTGFRNRIINGGMKVAQRSTSATVTAGTAVPTSTTGYPCVDRFFIYSTGANVVASQVVGQSSSMNGLSIAGAASVTAIGVGQRIEAINCYDLIGSTATLSVNLSNSLLTTVSWTASYATTTNTFGTIGTPTKTQIATGSFTVNSTMARYTTQISIPSAATTGIEILFTVGAQISGTFKIENVQFEKGGVATPFEFVSPVTELLGCQRYYQRYTNIIVSGYGVSGSWVFAQFVYVVTPRIVPSTISITNFNNSNSGNATINIIQIQSFRLYSVITATGSGYSACDVEVLGMEL